MKTITCEDVLLAMMAVIDGEESALSAEQIKVHSANCENCCQEIEQMQRVDNLFRSQKRQEQDVNLWRGVEPQIMTSPKAIEKSKWQLFFLFGLLLLIYKLLEMLPERDFGLAFKVVPLILVIIFFVLLKENPFKINTELTLEK